MKQPPNAEPPNAEAAWRPQSRDSLWLSQCDPMHCLQQGRRKQYRPVKVVRVVSLLSLTGTDVQKRSPEGQEDNWVPVPSTPNPVHVHPNRMPDGQRATGWEAVVLELRQHEGNSLEKEEREILQPAQSSPKGKGEGQGPGLTQVAGWRVSFKTSHLSHTL